VTTDIHTASEFLSWTFDSFAREYVVDDKCILLDIMAD